MGSPSAPARSAQEGELPLHHAVEKGAPAEVVMLLDWKCNLFGRLSGSAAEVAGGSYSRLDPRRTSGARRPTCPLAAWAAALLALSLYLFSFFWEEFGKAAMCIAPPAPTRTLRTEDEHFTVMLTVNAAGFDSLFHAWYMEYKKLSLPFEVLVIAEDSTAYHKLLNLYPDVIVERGHIHGSAEEAAFGSLEYKQLMAARPTHMLRHLRAGKDLIFSDVDAFWISDPLQQFSPDYDMWMPVEKPLNWPVRTHAYHNAGFMGVRSNKRTIRLIEAWERELLKIGPSRNQRVLHNVLIQDTAIRLQSLPHMYFPSGYTYFRYGCTAKAVVVHVYGGMFVGFAAKQSAFQKIGLGNDLPHRAPVLQSMLCHLWARPVCDGSLHSLFAAFNNTD